MNTFSQYETIWGQRLWHQHTDDLTFDHFMEKPQSAVNSIHNGTHNTSGNWHHQVVKTCNDNYDRLETKTAEVYHSLNKERNHLFQ